MELLRGENVHARVHRAGAVPLNEVVEILSQCCRALARAHAAGIVHRDIKPDNIFLTQTEEEGTLVKVLDFGIAKFASSPGDHSSTRTGAVLGTPLFMSPEQARGLKTIDHRTDIYSLGLVAYTMLTGNLAFSSESFGDLLVQICTAPLPSLCASAPWLPASMEIWFQRACAREPASRFASAQELSDALRVAAGVGRASALPESAVQPPPGGLEGNIAHAASIGTASGMSRTGDPSALPAIPKKRGALAVVLAMMVLGAIAFATVLTLAKKERPTNGVSTGAAVAPPAPPAVTVSAMATAAATLVAEPQMAPSASAASSIAAPGSAGSAHPAPPVPARAPPVRGVTAPPAPPSTPPRIAGPKPIDLGY
jgi:serine/threonine-protein kinase